MAWALAASILDRWHPAGAPSAWLPSGFLGTVSSRMRGAEWHFIGAAPVQATRALPYVLTVVPRAVFIGHAEAPWALGRPQV